MPWQQWVPMLVVYALGLACLAVIAWRGWLFSGALDRRPPRNLPLGPDDLLAGLALFLAGFVVAGGLVAAVTPAAATGSTQPATLRPLSQAALEMLGRVLMFAPPAIWTVLRARRQPGGLTELGLSGRRLGQALGAGLLAAVLVIPLVLATLNGTNAVAEYFGRPADPIGHQMLRQMLQAADARALALMLVSAVLAAPLLEELVFRGLLQTALANLLGRRRWLVVLLAALVFTGMHFGLPWQTWPGLFVLGVALGWLYERTGSLWPSVLLHLLFNAGNVALAFALLRHRV